MRKIFYLVITFAFIFVLLRLVDVGKSLSLIKEANFLFILLSIILGFLSSLLGALRLKTLFSIVGEVQLFFIWLLGYAGALISLIFPFSLGGFAMAYFLAKKLGISYKKSLVILFVDFFLGVVVVLGLALFAIPYFSQKGLLSVSISLSMLVVVFALFGVFFVLIFKSKTTRLQDGLGKLKKAFSLFSKSKTILNKAILLTIIIAFLGFIQAYLYFAAFGMRPPPLNFALASSLFGVLGLIPGAIAKIGQYETFGILTYPYLLNLDRNSVFATLFISHAVSIITIFILGVFSLFLLKIDRGVIKDISKAISSKRKLI